MVTVELYYNNSKKIETTDTKSVSGNVVSTGNVTGVDATFSGNVSVGMTLTMRMLQTSTQLVFLM